MIDQVEHQTLYDHIKELKSQIVQRSALVIGVTSWLLLIWSLWPTGVVEGARLTLRPVALHLLLISLFVYLVEKPLILREWALIGGTLVAAIGLIFSTRQIESMYFFMVPIALTYSLRGQGLAVAVTVLYIVFNIVLVVFLGFFVLADILLPIIVVVIITAIINASIHGLFILVDLSNRSIDLALHNQNSARDRRAELVKTLKSLDIAQQNLQRTNYALQHARRRAEEARQLKQQFAQAISHELRTPLNLIIGFTESMVKSPEYYGQPLPPKYSHDLSIVYRNAMHLQNLVNDVLDLARIEASQMSLQLDSVHLKSFLAEINETAFGLTRRHQLAFKLVVDECLPDTLWMDAVRIRQVLYNLIGNAARFTPAGLITLQIASEDNAVTFSVIDTGIGIAPEHHESIFEPFRQLENPMRRRIGGAGLGLSISRQLVALHGGKLMVESQPGHGSCFYFSLPSEPTIEARTGSEIKPGTHMTNNEDVALIVTTHAATAVLLSRNINSCRPLIVNGLDQLRRAMQQIIPQAIIFDRSGDDLKELDLREFARECPQPTTLISLSLVSAKELNKQFAVTGYLTKPILREQLFDTLRLFESEVEHILIVDDDRDFVKLITRMFDNPLRQYRISTAFNGYEAIAFLENQQPDLILLDLEMPGMNGVQILQQMRANSIYQNIPVVIMSAKEELEPYSAIVSKLEIFRAPYFNQQEILQMFQHIINQ